MVAEFLKNGFKIQKSMCFLGVLQIIIAILMITYISFATPKGTSGANGAAYDTDMDRAFKIVYAIFEAHSINFGIVMAVNILKVCTRMFNYWQVLQFLQIILEICRFSVNMNVFRIEENLLTLAMHILILTLIRNMKSKCSDPESPALEQLEVTTGNNNAAEDNVYTELTKSA